MLSLNIICGFAFSRDSYLLAKCEIISLYSLALFLVQKENLKMMEKKIVMKREERDKASANPKKKKRREENFFVRNLD